MIRRCAFFTALPRRGLHNASYVEKHSKLRGEPIPREAANSPGLQSLGARLGLTDVPAPSLARALIDSSSTLRFVNNSGLSRFGATLLSYSACEQLMARYPRLPAQVLSHAVDAYTGMPALAQIGRMWGIQPDTRSSLARYLSGNTDEQILGRLSFTDKNSTLERGVSVSDPNAGTDIEKAMGAAVRAVVAAVYAQRGLEGAQKFVQEHIITPRKLDVSKIMLFSRPTRELAVLCAREGLEEPVSRLIAESGRYSSQAVFVVGVFSGSNKLGEGQGNSLREARTRAAVNALKGWYLYSPTTKNAYVDAGEIVI